MSGSQKALMTPPGLAVVSVSETAWQKAPDAGLPRYYFDWERVRKAQSKFDAAFTPAVSLVGGLNVALGLILEEGLEAAFERHLRLGRACRGGSRRWGSSSSRPTTTARPSSPPSPSRRRSTRRELVATIRDRFGITLAPGQGG